jgi:feruloyl esterase
MTWAGTTFQAVSEPPGPFPVPDPSPFVPDLGELPGFCRVTAVIRPVPGSEIGVEIWLPTAWNRRMLQVGNGGFAGAINYAGLATAIKHGFVGVSTDDGHRTPASVTPTAVWSIGHPERIVDFGHRAVHLSSAAGKAVIERYFGHRPEHAYFSGCSDGGREALMSAQRNPDDFDGWVVGAPANNWTLLMAGLVYVSRQVDSLPKPAFTAAVLQTISRGALAECDALDGIKDGIIGRPRECHFDPRSLVCRDSHSSSCLSVAQANVVMNIYRGPPESGDDSPPGYADTIGAESWFWPQWLTGPLLSPAFKEPNGAAFGRAYFQEMVYQQEGLDISAISALKLIADSRAGPGRDVDAVDPHLGPVRAAGKKIIQYHGQADAAIPADYSRRYYAAVQKQLGGPVTDFYRLFLMPGVGHCSGGPGADLSNADNTAVPFDSAHDVVAALMAWVENGKAPERLIARHVQTNSATGVLNAPSTGTVQLTRPLCVYPKQASWTGSGSSDDAANFVCR